ncbi:hypothetical protein GGX14DRAFT_359631 [Mycena pura]|uniref:Helitron helicase-like domain-containing protein n=1 Tax=Mycena pura TaxID=153505 RepID=A0AAD6YG67_9AGAR|nr:hypothetical protein GGX14DRAFT_359631 [Mycena pura]
MKAFISCLLKYDPKQRDLEGGVFGVVKGYYGCVEAQGRGTLHCHMLVWIEGGLNPNEIKRRVLEDPEFQHRLITYLEDSISNSIPPDPNPDLEIPSSVHNPCSVRGLDPATHKATGEARRKDMHLLVKQCQWHEHSKTCYKYWKGPGQPKECRFDLDPSNTRPETTVDPETGEICLRCLDGLVNNFNSTILEALRCNMDIKFIGSGASAKAILYYITDYITKSQLKAHVAYAALELAVKKLGEFVPNEDDITVRSKHMLQKCAYALISHQELSAQQVASYLLDFEDHFTSHQFAKLFWTSFESIVEQEIPSPECYPDRPTAAAATANASEPEDESGASVQAEDNAGSDETQDSENGVIQGTELELDYGDDPEVSITFDHHGNIHSSVNAVADYCARGNELDTVCVWDFVARIKKVTKKSVESKRRQSNDDSADEDFPPLDVDMDDGSDNEEEEEEAILDCIKRARPRVEFRSDHPQADSHLLCDHPFTNWIAETLVGKNTVTYRLFLGIRFA